MRAKRPWQVGQASLQARSSRSQYSKMKPFALFFISIALACKPYGDTSWSAPWRVGKEGTLSDQLQCDAPYCSATLPITLQHVNTLGFTLWCSTPNAAGHSLVMSLYARGDPIPQITIGSGELPAEYNITPISRNFSHLSYLGPLDAVFQIAIFCTPPCNASLTISRVELYNCSTSTPLWPVLLGLALFAAAFVASGLVFRYCQKRHRATAIGTVRVEEGVPLMQR